MQCKKAIILSQSYTHLCTPFIICRCFRDKIRVPPKAPYKIYHKYLELIFVYVVTLQTYTLVLHLCLFIIRHLFIMNVMENIPVVQRRFTG